MIWVFWIALCALMAWMIDERPARYCLALCGAGLLVMQIPQIVPMGDMRWLFSAAIWTTVSVASWRHSVTFFALTLLSATCYTYGRIYGYEFGPDAAPLFWADMAGLAALLSIGGRGVWKFVGSYLRGRAMGRSVRRPGFNRSVDTVEEAGR